MNKKQLTLQEIEIRQEQLEEESHKDELTYLMGLMGKPEMVERTVRREVEKRWLALDAVLAKTGKSRNLLH